MPGILALDIATTTGAAYAAPGERPQWWHQRFGKPGAANGEIGRLFASWLSWLISETKPEWLIFESPFVPPKLNNNTIRRLYGIAFIAESQAFRYGIECREVDTASVAKFFTGKARWKPASNVITSRDAKKAATRRVCERYGWTSVTEDEADALAVLVYAEALIYPEAAIKRGSFGPLFTAPNKTAAAPALSP